MAVPEATMDKDHGLPPGKGYIRSTGKVFAMQPIAQSSRMKAMAQQQFGFCISRPDRRHIPAARLSVVNISQRVA